MKANQIFGTIMCVLGLVCASGESVTNGLLAIVFLSVGVLSIKAGNAMSETSTEACKERERKQAAA